MPKNRFHLSYLAGTAAEAEAMDTNFIRGSAACLKLASLWRMLMQDLRNKDTQPEAEDFLRGIYAKTFRLNADYYLDKSYCTLEELREKVVDTYAVLSAVGRGDNESPLVARAMEMCRGIKYYCNGQLNSLLPKSDPTPRPRLSGRKVSVWPDLTLYETR